MKKELISELFEKFEKARIVIDNIECWSARDLQSIFNYSDWRNFVKVVDKAKISCKSSNNDVSDHFVDTNKMVGLGSGSKREITDIALTRYACYLIAQNGDPSKQEIAFAQTYFAVQTRKQELIENRLLEVERVKAREKLTNTEKILSAIIYERGVDDYGFAIIRSKGDAALFGGFNTNDMKLKLAIPVKRPLADFLPTLTIKAKDFATELTSHNVEEKNLKGTPSISEEHIENNKAVRKILLERGVKPENLPPSEDVKKVKRRLNSEELKLLKENNKKE
ncbi:MAG: DNA damage-inducible protein D [Ignavibacteria bacterium]|nr:DNA damage-inducible protein D [Ignavibacteria bacterium]